jgi:hypothetical protein
VRKRELIVQRKTVGSFLLPGLLGGLILAMVISRRKRKKRENDDNSSTHSSQQSDDASGMYLKNFCF